ncbi:MAG: App1 family protein [Methylotenera sp.]|nr:App1 family protein [Oligoflexia bacterium]
MNPFIVVSDLDDTIKISHTMDQFRTVLRGLFSHQAYAGMAELYTELARTPDSLIVLSSSPLWIRKRVHEFLRRNRFPKAQVILRDWVKQPQVRKYKFNALKQLAEKSTEPFILFGDDTEYDPEVFESFLNEYPDRVLKIYIRRMRGRPLPEGMQGFHTSYEIALSEFAAGRLDLEQVHRIGKAVADTRNPAYIIPHFAVLPEEILQAPESEALSEIHERVLARLRKIVGKRKRA